MLFIVLVLFDIDGTLLFGRPEGHTQAMTDAMVHVWGVPAVPDDVWGIDPAGRTDRAIARLVLSAYDVGDDDIDARTPEWMTLASALHAEVAHEHPAPVAAPDARDVVTALTAGGGEIALVTGNLEPIGRHKVAAAGLGDLFAPGAGGFGSDAEHRGDLVRLARDRAARLHEADEVFVVGDTPRDIAAARDAGVQVIAVTTGAHDRTALESADGVAASLMEALTLIRG